jgi:hypothetical protein
MGAVISNEPILVPGLSATQTGLYRAVVGQCAGDHEYPTLSEPTFSTVRSGRTASRRDLQLPVLFGLERLRGVLKGSRQSSFSQLRILPENFGLRGSTRRQFE